MGAGHAVVLEGGEVQPARNAARASKAQVVTYAHLDTTVAIASSVDAATTELAMTGIKVQAAALAIQDGRETFVMSVSPITTAPRVAPAKTAAPYVGLSVMTALRAVERVSAWMMDCLE